jgi:DNA-binding response OmpR family regulator
MILDILIPGVDGIEVCRRMKNDVESRTSIIAMSGQPELESTIAKAGADVFMAKPLDLERLLHEAKRLLRVL